MHLIKRYSNRKLYDASDRKQITLDGIARLITSGDDVKVVDNDSGEDITTVILTEILLERERESTGPFSKSILTGLVRAGTATFEQFRRTLTGTGIVQLAEQEVERVINTWVEIGHMTEQEVLRTVEDVIDKRRKMRGDDDGFVEERLTHALKEANVPTRTELERLAAQVHGLSVQVNNLIEEIRKKQPTPQ
ncbi:MAG TPA: polyhydroxyalkanoate synthesis regulator DNA-binding domain-containing protein [Chloroflexota bacterium]|nr:polyhydroxyalkanoate synthesis regulator DNA-binding domain-containing protein [Chloroflexota bacterium]